MNELEQAFEELAREEDEKLSQRLEEKAAEELPSETELFEEEAEAAEGEQAEEAFTPKTENKEEGFKVPAIKDDTHSKKPVATDLDSILKTAKENSSKWEQQLKELSELSGTAVYGMNGIRQLPNYEKMSKLIRAGASLADAYKATNYESLVRTQVQKEKNKIIGKAHLKASGGGAKANEVTVPRDVYLAFKMLEPKITDDEIRRFYKKTHQN